MKLRCLSKLRLIKGALYLGLMAGPALFAQKTVIHAGTLIDGPSDQVKTEQSILIENGKILRVEAGYVQVGENDKLIDLKGFTVMPGLMDMHTHHSGQLSKDSYNEGFRMDPADYAFRMVGFAEKTLMAGFTTVRELGDQHNLSISLKNAVAKGWVVGPRIFTAGKSLATTGGHADPTNGLNAVLRGDPGPKQGVVNSVEDARKAVRQRYKDGADLIKITATGGVLSVAKNGQNPQFTEEEVRAIVETAADYGFKVAAHAHGAEGMKRAIRAGVASIEHGTYLDDEGMALMKQKGTYLVPTLMAGREVTEMSKIPGFLPEVVRPKAAAIGPVMKSTLAKAYKAGVKLAFGTDCGVSPHGANGLEFQLMVEAGVPPLEALRTATVYAADLLGESENLGSIEPGKFADIVAVKGDPLADMTLLQNIDFVMKAGVVYKQR